MTQLQRCIDLATKHHFGQYRKYSDLDYITHPLSVLKRLQKYNLGEDVECATVLHDVLEDCDITKEEIVEASNINVFNYVVELTNPSKNSVLNRKARKQMDREHLATVSDETKIIKLCDRIDNLTDINECPDIDFAYKYCQESKLLLECLVPTSGKYLEAFEELRNELAAIIDNIKFKKKE
jgi:(p)ppGpp synthase/HD superfamily hydrolase